MLCPVCKVELKMAERQGVEIDYCPQCRGVWLDRGELDKIIERSADSVMPPAPPVAGQRRYDDDDDDYRYREGHYPEKRKRKSLLDELFDF
ncbi:MAG: zf-TFIIB domain-containing protein [Chloroflexi bacterium]|nr:zf-TFIIB domain-containing protein [Chloroflexota bacterium]